MRTYRGEFQPTPELSNREFYAILFNASLTHRILLPYEEVLEYVDTIESYNDFEAERVKSMLDTIDDLIPRIDYGEGNPNNGKRGYTMLIGRELSPVIYIAVSGSVVEGLERVDFVVQSENYLQEIAEDIGSADEFSVEVEEDQDLGWKEAIIRLWWD